MGQKVNPHGLRVGVIKNWDSRWFVADNKIGDLILEDNNIRKFLKKKLYAAGIPTIDSTGEAVYPMTPGEFAGIVGNCVELGAKIVGGCCGTDPDFIRAVKEKVCR